MPLAYTLKFASSFLIGRRKITNKQNGTYGNWRITVSIFTKVTIFRRIWRTQHTQWFTRYWLQTSFDGSILGAIYPKMFSDHFRPKAKAIFHVFLWLHNEVFHPLGIPYNCSESVCQSRFQANSDTKITDPPKTHQNMWWIHHVWKSTTFLLSSPKTTPYRSKQIFKWNGPIWNSAQRKFSRRFWCIGFFNWISNGTSLVTLCYFTWY